MHCCHRKRHSYTYLISHFLYSFVPVLQRLSIHEICLHQEQPSLLRVFETLPYPLETVFSQAAGKVYCLRLRIFSGQELLILHQPWQDCGSQFRYGRGNVYPRLRSPQTQGPAKVLHKLQTTCFQYGML